jgi:hypothetical protein
MMRNTIRATSSSGGGVRSGGVHVQEDDHNGATLGNIEAEGGGDHSREARNHRRQRRKHEKSQKNTWQSITENREQGTRKTSYRYTTSAANRRRRRSSTGSPTEKGRT